MMDSEKVAIGRRFTSQTLFLVRCEAVEFAPPRVHVGDVRNRSSRVLPAEKNAQAFSLCTGNGRLEKPSGRRNKG